MSAPGSYGAYGSYISQGASSAAGAAEKYAKEHPITVFVIVAMVCFFLGIILFAVGAAENSKDKLKSKNYTIAGMFFFMLTFVPLAFAFSSVKSVKDYINKSSLPPR